MTSVFVGFANAGVAGIDCMRTDLAWIPFPRAMAAGEARIIDHCMESGCWTATVIREGLSARGTFSGGVRGKLRLTPSQ